MQEQVLIVGASVRGACQCAARAGFRVMAADLFADRDLIACARTWRVTDYPSQFARIARDVAPGVWMYTGGLENQPDLVDEISVRHELLGNPGRVLRRVRDPWQLASALRRAQLLYPHPRHELPETRSGAWLRKPQRGCGGIGIRLVPLRTRSITAKTGRQTTCPPAAGSVPGPPHAPIGGVESTYYQPYVRGRPVSALFVAAAGQATLLGVTRQLLGGWSGVGQFRYVGSIGPVRLNNRLRDTFRQLGACLAEAFDLRGLFGVDAVIAGEEVWTIEVNPRFTASVEIVERITGLSAITVHQAACRQGELPVVPGRLAGTRHGKLILFARQDLRVDGPWERWLGISEQEQWPALTDLPPIGSRITRGAPVLTVFASGTSCREVGWLLRRRAEHVHRFLACRTV
jgi:uncharacterized protein